MLLLHGRWLTRKLRGVDDRLVKDYGRDCSVKKLHLGCGEHFLPGWLNSDLFPKLDHLLHLDVTKSFFFETYTFDYVYGEHIIEHLSYPQGQHMLSECHRVLKDYGKIRLATPDLSFLMDIYRGERSELQVRYLQWLTEDLHDIPDESRATFLLNKFVRHWGHRFIYDEKLLRAALQQAGFSHITRCALQESQDPELRNLAYEERIPPGFLGLETVTLEAVKLPSSR